MSQTQTLDRLYELLPAVYRLRDAEAGYPLRALLRVINEQASVCEADIAQLYENWFIETCEDWVVPYIGDLIGYRQVHEAGAAGESFTAEARRRNQFLFPRRDVAATLRSRRRKGTLALLELLANDVAGWPARAVEFYRLLGWTQHLNHTRAQQGNLADLRQGETLALLSSPFAASAQTIDVRRITSPHDTRGRYNLPSVGVFIWRLKTYSVTRAPARCIDEVGPHAYTFSALGHDEPLYHHPQPETSPTHIAEELNLPVPITRRALTERIEDGEKTRTQAAATYYGVGENNVGRSLAIWAADWPQRGAPQPLPREAIIPTNLQGWRYRAPLDHVLVDPERGRIVFPPGQLPKRVRVSYHYSFSADIGGGEYDRPLAQPEPFALYRVRRSANEHEEKTYRTVQEALKRWHTEKAEAQTDQERLRLRSAVIEIADSDVYAPLSGENVRHDKDIEIADSAVYVEQQSLQIELATDESLQLRAANRTRPIIRLLDYTEGMDALNVNGARGSRLTLDGLTITGRGVQINGPKVDAEFESEQKATDTTNENDLCAVTIRHCTLVPGWELDSHCEPQHIEPSLLINYTRAQIKIEHSIIGAIHVAADEVKSEPVRLQISDSIVDATGNELAALGSQTLPLAYVALRIARSTVIGEIHTHAIELAENCIFNGLVRVARRQQGGVRFCYVPPGSRTPRRYQCQPDLAMAGVTGADEKTREQLRVRPQFNSTRYGTPTYCQLAEACADEIKRGADDESEMGVFHDLYQPQRAANLRSRLDEYTPAGMEAGIIYAN